MSALDASVERQPAVLVATTDDAIAAVLTQGLRAMLPSLTVMRLDPAAIPARIPAARCAVVGPSFGGYMGIEACRVLRAGGFDGAMVYVGDDGVPDPVESMARLGVACALPVSAILTDLAGIVSGLVDASDDSPLARELRHSHRLMAAGEIALSLQHAANNPLTALLAEAQLLALEPLEPEHAGAVGRIVELCRRVAGVVRRLDVVSTRRADEGAARPAASAAVSEAAHETARTSQL